LEQLNDSGGIDSGGISRADVGLEDTRKKKNKKKTTSSYNSRSKHQEPAQMLTAWKGAHGRATRCVCVLCVCCCVVVLLCCCCVVVAMEGGVSDLCSFFCFLFCSSFLLLFFLLVFCLLPFLLSSFFFLLFLSSVFFLLWASIDINPGSRGSGLILKWQQLSGRLFAAGNSSVIRVWDLNRKCMVHVCGSTGTMGAAWCLLTGVYLFLFCSCWFVLFVLGCCFVLLFCSCFVFLFCVLVLCFVLVFVFACSGEQCVSTIPSGCDTCVTAIGSDWNSHVGGGEGVVMCGYGDGSLRLFDAR